MDRFWEYIRKGLRAVITFSSIRLFKKTPRELKRLHQAILNKYYFPKYTLSELGSELIRLGVTKGRTVLVHSSWNEMSNLCAKPKDLITLLLDLIGPEGTLLMPAYPIGPLHDDMVFDVRKTPSGAGLLTEVFRRMPGVHRSINLDHSVCALGPNAKFLLDGHVASLASCDANSPYYKLKHVGGLIVGLGVGHGLKVATSLHCVDSILRDEIPFFKEIYVKEIPYRFIDFDGGRGNGKILLRQGRLNTQKVARYMDRSKLLESNLSNLKLYSVEASYLIDRAMELGRNGITMYEYPRPARHLFKLNGPLAR